MEKKIYAMLAVLIIFIVGLCGCLGDNSPSVDVSKFVGTWTSDDKNAPYVFGDQVAFNEDGSMTYSSSHKEASFEIKDGTISITYPDGSSRGSTSFSFSENYTILTLTDSGWNKPAIYEKKESNSGGTAVLEEKELSEIHGQ